MLGLSIPHLLLLAVIAIVFIGPEQLPEVARTVARLLNEWKRASSDITTSLTKTFNEDLNPNHQLPPSSPEHLDAKDRPLEDPPNEGPPSEAPPNENQPDKKS